MYLIFLNQLYMLHATLDVSKKIQYYWIKVDSLLIFKFDLLSRNKSPFLMTRLW